MGEETFVMYPPFYGYYTPYSIAPSIYPSFTPRPIIAATERSKLYGPYGPYTYGPY